MHRGELRAVALAIVVAGGCGDPETPRDAVPASEPIAGLPGRVHIDPGPPPYSAARFENPYAGDPQALQEGQRLYGWYNCAGCHGSKGGGGMGPPLRDHVWLYGNEPVSVFESIVEGRPNGMPTWRGKIPDDQVWKIVAYVLSLGQHPHREQPQEGIVEAGGRPAGAN